MKRMRKVKKMQLGAEPKASVNKKTIGIFLASITLVAFAGIMGVMMPNNADAAPRYKGKHPLTKFDRIMYWPDGQMGSEECNMDLPAKTAPKCYQPIPQKYALGFINNEKTIERFARKLNVKNGKVSNTYKTPQATLIRNGYNISGDRSPLKFIDLINGASYMGNLYDVRIYAYGSAYVNSYRNSIVEHYHYEGADVASEWHFYPRNTLKELDELYYVEEKNSVESGEGDLQDECSDIKEKDPKNPKKTIVVGKKCTYDKNAYRDADGKVIYTGTFREGSIYGPIKYTAAEMEAHLIERENSVRVLGIEGMGTFYGTVAFKDIDAWSVERYAAASGVASVFTTWNSNEFAKQATVNSGKASIYSQPRFKHFCQNPTPDDSCYYAWGGTGESNPTSMESWMWFNFSSNSAAPFALVYSGGGHGSMIESEQFYITHILMDDLSTIPEEVIVSAQNFQQDFKNLYGHPLEEDKNFPSDYKSEADRVLRFFPIYQYANYDPYTMNDLLGDLTGGKKLKWYSCPQMTEDCLVPYDPEHDDGSVTVGDTTYTNGYDFVSGSRIYYASMNDPMEINFPNTCYSDNTSTVEVKNGQ